MPTKDLAITFPRIYLGSNPLRADHIFSKERMTYMPEESQGLIPYTSSHKERVPKIKVGVLIITVDGVG
jgi:hypothetical protein